MSPSSSSSEASRLLRRPDHGCHPSPCHLPQPGHAHRERRQRSQRGLPEHGESMCVLLSFHSLANKHTVHFLSHQPHSLSFLVFTRVLFECSETWDVETRCAVNCLWSERAPSVGLSLEALMEVVLKYIKAVVVSGSLCLAPQWNHDLCDVWKAVIYFLFSSLTTRGHERVTVWNPAPSLPLLFSPLLSPSLSACTQNEPCEWPRGTNGFFSLNRDAQKEAIRFHSCVVHSVAGALCCWRRVDV